MGAFSPGVIKGLVEAITGGAGFSNTAPVGIYRKGYELSNFFADVGIDFRVGQASRVPAVHELLRSLNDSEDGFERIQAVLERSVDPSDYRAL